MMQHLTNDPAFWVSFWALMGMLFTAAATLLGLLIAWAKVKTAEYEARDAKGTAKSAIAGIDRMAQAAGTVAAQVSTHTAQIAALEAVTTSAAGERGQGAAMPAVAPVAPPVPVAPPSVPSAPTPPPTTLTPPSSVTVPLSSSPQATEHTTGGIVAMQNGYPPPPET